jgi:hypothetical protein
MKGQVVSWWRLLWFDLTIPRHSFIGWLAMKNKLPTKERMIQWGFNGDSKCVLCNTHVENRDHLFFLCSFTKRIWKNIMSLFLISDIDCFWLKLVEWATDNLKGVVLE